MKTYCFVLSYDGTRYRGWQRQGNTTSTIQAKIELILSKMTGHKIEIHGAGRTDAGVHASAQVASTRMETELTPAEIQQYLNRYLPNDIAVLSCCEMPDRFHARLNALGKRYCYCINDSGIPDVFRSRYTYHCDRPLDVEKMRLAACYLCGTHDFRGYSSVHKRVKKSTIRTIHSIDIERVNGELHLVFHGSGFLYNMVRILAGTLVEVGSGQRSAESVVTALESLNRQDAGITLPAQGLILEEVEYSQTISAAMR